MARIVSAEEAVSYIKDGDVLALSGFTGAGFCQEIYLALRKRFLETGHPRNLTLLYAAGQGCNSLERGIDIIAIEGLIGRVISSHYGLSPGIRKLIVENKIIAYSLPQGVISQLFREIAAKRPGLVTKVGLYTYVDPRVEGGKANELTREKGEDLVKLIKIDGEEYLFYKAIPVDVAIIRGTTADEKGNISMEREGLTLENLSVAQAAKNSGGITIAQVERIAMRNTLPARMVEIPHIFVDYVVKARPENHWQTAVEPYNPAISGEIRIPLEMLPKKPLNERKVIGRRALIELVELVRKLGKPPVVNLGIGMPEEVAACAAEEGISEAFTLTVESGVIGGVPLGGLYFGVGVNFDAVIDQPYQFDFYDGGGLDITFLGMAEVDEEGNVNVSNFAGRYVGCGGFINISQGAKRVVFCGTFTAGGLKVDVKDGKLKIVQEGRFIKFVKRVKHVTFSGYYAKKVKKPVMYITERAVFRLTDKGLVLEEVAPGIDVDKDILEKMEFKPVIPEEVKTMDPRIFREEVIGLKNALKNALT